MRLLIVEDDLDTIDVLRQQLDGPGDDLVVAQSRESAEVALAGDFFDLVICDLNIPTSDGVLDGSVDHGMAVLASVRSTCRGTPVIGFSAYGATPGLLNRLLGMGWQEDFLGVGQDEPVLNFLDKTALDECVIESRRVHQEIDALGEIEIATGFDVVELTPAHERVLRIYARRRVGRVLKVAKLGGGLSDSRVVRLRIEGGHGEHVATLVAKLGPIDAIDDERNRLQQQVAGSLQLGSCPGLVGVVRAGAGSFGGLFYELAGEFPESLFDVLRRESVEAAAVVTRVADVVAPWRDGAPVGETSVAEVRQAFIDVEEARQELEQHGLVLDADLEGVVVQSRTCVLHGDLHGLNVLVGAEGAPLLIDFGEVRYGPAATDPVVMELSALFHPDAPDILGDWPTADQARLWFDLESYADGCPIVAFVRACRQWASAQGVAAGDREVAAVVYGFAMRQLKYEQTNKEVALALVAGASERLRS